MTQVRLESFSLPIPREERVPPVVVTVYIHKDKKMSPNTSWDVFSAFV